MSIHSESVCIFAGMGHKMVIYFGCITYLVTINSVYTIISLASFSILLVLYFIQYIFKYSSMLKIFFLKENIILLIYFTVLIKFCLFSN